MHIKVVLADDHGIVRAGLRSLLDKDAHIVVVGEAEDGHGALKAVRELHPDVVVMDVSMPGLNGVEAAGRIRCESPETRVVALSMHKDKRFVTSMLKAGALGYVLKNSAAGELIQAIKSAMTNHVYLSPPIATVITEDYLRHMSDDNSSMASVLSPKERQVLQLLAEGRSSKEISSDLCVSVKTVETHRRHIAEKLDLHSIAELTKYAIREGLVSLDE